MKTDHAHVEASLAALILTGIPVLIDLFVDAADGHALKIPAYFLFFFIVYGITKVFFNKLWSGDK